MSFNPNKRAQIKRAAIDRALFWYEVRLYVKVALIVFLPFAVLLWMMLEWMNR